MNLRNWLLHAASSAIVLLDACSAVAGPQFLTLPFTNPNVFLRQGWVYDSPGDFLCTDFPPGYQDRCHKGIDYFCVLDNTVTTFEVLAAAPGKAMASYTENGYGYFVLIAHDQVDNQGRRIFTLYAHLQNDSWMTNFKPKGELLADIAAQDFSSWTTLSRGQKLALAGKSGGWPQIHLHFEVQLGGYAVNKADPYDIYGTKDFYSVPCTPSPVFPTQQSSTFPDSFWTQCPPVSSESEVVLQPGPDDGKDIWTTSVFSYAVCSAPGPGGGLNDDRLRVGGWGDLYYTLIQFDLAETPAHASSALLNVYCHHMDGGGTPIYLDRITESWDWQTSGTGCDFERLWWADRPQASQWRPDPLPTPAFEQWYAIDITDLYNSWKNGTYPNYGLQLRPQFNFNNNFDEFRSSDYTSDPALRPKLVIKP